MAEKMEGEQLPCEDEDMSSAQQAEQRAKRIAHALADAGRPVRRSSKFQLPVEDGDEKCDKSEDAG